LTALGDNFATRWLPIGIAGTAIILGLLAGLQPKFAVAAIFGITFAVIALTNLNAGVCIFATVWYFSEVISSIPAAKMMGIVLVGSWLAIVTVGRLRGRQIFEDNRFLYLLGVFIVWAGASALWAEHAGPAVTAVTRYAPNALLFPIFYAAVRERDDALKIVGAMIIGALLGAAFGVVNPSFGEDPGRLSGALGNANATAASMVVTLVLLGGLAGALRDRPWTRGVVILALPLPLVFLFMTASRGGLIGLIVVLVAATVMAGRWRKLMVAIIAMVVVGAVVYFAALAPPSATERVTHPEGGTGRSDIWKVGWRLVEAHPINGVGAGNFVTSTRLFLLKPGLIERDDFILDTPKVAHNTYLQLAAELGIVGLGLFLAAVVWVLVFAARAARQFTRAGDIGMSVMAKAVFIALLGYLAGAFFDAREYASDLWLLMALAPALLAVAHRELARRTAVEAEWLEQQEPVSSGPVAGPRGYRPLPV
jgi:putative inorganic carbon (HCO3(-)) transporter